MTALQVRNRDFSVLAERLQGDMFRLLEQSREAFDVMIFKAVISSEGQQTDDSEFVGTLEQFETKLDYASPVVCKAIELPDNNAGEFITASGIHGDGELPEPNTMVFSDPEVPEQSVILVNDQVGDEVVTSLYFVLDVLPIGRHGLAGKKHLVIPFRGDVSSLLDADNDGVAEQIEFGDLSGLLAQ